MPQRIPLRSLIETTVGRGLSVPAAPNAAAAPSLGWSPASGQIGVHLETQLIAQDVISDVQTNVSAAASGYFTYSATRWFANIPTNQRSPTSTVYPASAKQILPFLPPPETLPILNTWSAISNISGTNSNLLIHSQSIIQPVARDNNQIQYTGHLLGAGVTYTQFGTNVTFRFYNPSAAAITFSFNFDVYGMLFLVYAIE